MNKVKSIIERYLNNIFNKLNEKKIQNHRLIFYINSGRSGSQYLAELLGTAKEVVSFHEPAPPMTGDFLTLANTLDYNNNKSKRIRRIKSYTIKNYLRNLPENKVYCETNHMFIKTFFDVICEDFKQVNVIILRRYLPSVLKSFVELGYFSDRHPNWHLWMSRPDAVTSAIPCLNYQELDQYDRCIAYLIDIEARAIRFQQEYPSIITSEVRLESLNNYQNVLELFETLSITPTQATETIYTEKINQRSNLKIMGKENTVSLADCEERINNYIDIAIAQGVKVPHSLALKA
ncbi:MAG: hypothetical protein IGQ45_00185 [Cyanobacterium sp. T60_A2020_053]|nr:hypothetical protein [Cyanobacterium sp. T60_A2020_053]